MLKLTFNFQPNLSYFFFSNKHVTELNAFLSALKSNFKLTSVYFTLNLVLVIHTIFFVLFNQIILGFR